MRTAQPNRPMHCMLNAETLGRKPGSAVMTIGATLFELDADPFAPDSPHLDERNHLYIVISSTDSTNQGFTTEAKTMQWWRDQPISAELFKETLRSTTTVLAACNLLADFVAEKKPLKVWSNSPTFDVEIIRALYERSGKTFPFHYRQEMDFRTTLDLAYPEREDRPPRPESLFGYHAHHALGDAMFQAHQVMLAIRKLRITPDFNLMNTDEIVEKLSALDPRSSIAIARRLLADMRPEDRAALMAEFDPPSAPRRPGPR